MWCRSHCSEYSPDEQSTGNYRVDFSGRWTDFISDYALGYFL